MIFIIGLVGCEEKIPQNFIVEINDSIEVYSAVYLFDIIKATNGNIISDNLIIDTNELGNKIYPMEFELDGKKFTYDISINIVDTEAPKYFGGLSKITYVGEEKDLCSLVFYGDNYDRDVKCEIIGDYDINNVDFYELTYVFTDNSGNKAELDFIFNVIEKPTSSNNSGSSTKLQFTEALELYKTSDTELGIDVSRWQGDIDFNQVKEAGASFVIIRIGVQTELEEMPELDKSYLDNITKAKEAGLKVGIYLYSYPISKEESIKHAKWIIDILDGIELDLPIIFDWEEWYNWNNFNLNFNDINEIADSFLETVNSYGYKGMLYSSKNYLDAIWENKNNYPVWLAHYIKNTNYKGDYSIWQLSNVGRIDGINTDVDINVMYK